MAYKDTVLLVIVTCNFLQVCVGSDSFLKPQILLNGTEDIVPTNDNYSLFCQGNRPLEWTTPKVKDVTLWTTFRTEEEIPSNTKFQYGLRLYITNMTYPFVGFYNCRYQNSSNDDDMDKKYLYVEDDNQLTVFSPNQPIINVYVIQDEVAIIPCRPTSPDVKVTLFFVDNYVEGNQEVFDSKIGFSFLFSDLSQIGIYMCTFSRKDESFDMLVNVELGDPYTSYIAAPVLTDENKGHTDVGGTIHLKCNLRVQNNEVIFSWITPSPFDKLRMNKTDIQKGSILTIQNVTLEDSGLYICQVSDHQHHEVSRNISIKVFDKDEYNLTIKEPNDLYYTEAKAGEDFITWSVEAWGHPEPHFFWVHRRQDNKNITINEQMGKKYEFSHSNNTRLNNNLEILTLKIKNIDLSQDFGTYILYGRNKYIQKSLEFFLNVTDKPTVSMLTEPFHLVGVPGKVECTAAAHPTPVFEWQYKSCLKPECEFIDMDSDITRTEGLTVSSEITINANESGIIKCTASNSIGSDTEQTEYFVTDVANGFAITGFDETVEIDNETNTATYAVQEKLNISCTASIDKYSQPSWLINGTYITENEEYKLTKQQSSFSTSLILEIENVRYDDNGLYSCRVYTNNTKEVFKNMSVVVTDPVNAEIIDTNMDGEIWEDFPKSVTFRCMVKGIPKPKITWYKNNIDFNPSDPRIIFANNNQILTFNETEEEDQGTYKCYASNRVYSDSREVKLQFRNSPTMQGWLVYIIAFLLLLLAVVMVYLFIRLRTEQRLKREMKLLGLANFEKGAVENINPELGIDDQAELLPYDRKWEFPIEQLKLGKQLGSGAFGVVLKGEAKHIVEGEPVTTVAVKMVKKNADHTYIKALASELKIMVHLGKHLNVVNLLGACTKNVAKRELLVIVEYCRFGNLQNFLLRHRDHYINQIDPQTGKVNYLIGQDELMDRTYSVSSNRSNTQSPLLKYAALAFSDSGNGSVLPPPNAMGDYRAPAISVATDITTTQGEDTVILSNNSIQPEWRSNYRGDYKGNVQPISTKDLIAWSFQIARGMDYLASRKVLHGDLAARNILLSDDNIVKICDFGLAKSMYKNDNYKKRGDCPLPVKWMAIESIRDRVFSTQSDAWSFGIVLWEMFSLGRTPYPGMEADERLYHKLLDGYRLESPEYSPKEIYQIMTECWSAKPTARPSFTKLTEQIGTLLEDTLRKHYIDLNDPYLAMNTRMLEGQNDYLAMLSPPTFESVATPYYVNDPIGLPTQNPEEGYMSMKPSTIFSPRISDANVFDFNTSNRKNLQNEDAKGSELLPMLNLKNESDIDTPCSSPNAVSNPSYHIPPTIEVNEENNTEILKSVDNYVNMPQNKNLLRDSKSNLNIDNKKGEPQYVNENKDWNSINV